MKNKQYHTQFVLLNHPYSHRPYKNNGTVKTYIYNNSYKMNINIYNREHSKIKYQN